MTSSQTIVLITGANSGIGYTTTKVLISTSPSYHIIMAGRSSTKLSTAASSITSSPSVQGTLSTLVLDVTSQASITSAFAEASKSFPRIDVLINNAGTVSQDPSLDLQFSSTFATNTIGPVLVTNTFRPLLLKSPSPRVVHVTSGMGSLTAASDPEQPFHGAYLAYSMSKAALNMYVIESAKELGEHGVKVWGLCPGLVRSNLRGTEEMQVNAGGRADDPEVSGRLIRDVVEGRRDGDVGRIVRGHGVWDW